MDSQFSLNPYPQLKSLVDQSESLGTRWKSLAALDVNPGDKPGFDEKRGTFYISGEKVNKVVRVTEKSWNVTRSLASSAKWTARKYGGERNRHVTQKLDEMTLEMNAFVTQFREFIIERYLTPAEQAYWEELGLELFSMVDKIKENLSEIEKSYSDRSEVQEKYREVIGSVQTLRDQLQGVLNRIEVIDEESALYGLRREGLEKVDRPATQVEEINQNSAKDIAYQNLSTAKAALDCFNDLSAEVQSKLQPSEWSMIEDVTEEARTKIQNQVEVFLNTLEIASSKPARAVAQANRMKEASSIQSEMTKTLKDYLETVEFLISTKRKFADEEFESLGDSKRLAKLFSVYIPSAHSSVRNHESVLTSTIEMEGHTFTERAERVEAARYLYEQKRRELDGHDLAEALDSITQDTVDDWLSQYTEMKFTNPEFDQDIYDAIRLKKMMFEGAWRSSMEAKRTAIADPAGKANMIHNAWIETFLADGGNEYRFVRNGIISDFSNSKTNVQELEGEEKQVRMDRLLNMLGQVVTEHAVLAGQRLDHSILQGNRTLPITHMGLVHPKKGSDEYHMLMDMEAAFQAFQGVRVQYDGKRGLDQNGVLHVPLQIVDEREQPLVLDVDLNLFNVSLKGGGKAVEKQVELNVVAYQKLKTRVHDYIVWLVQESGYPKDEVNKEIKEIRERAKHIKQQLESKKSTIDLAADITELESMIHTSIGEGCKSDKDRGSLFANKLLERYIIKHIGRTDDHLTERCIQEVFNKSVGLYITGMNTFVKGYKLSPQQWYEMGGIPAGTKLKQMAYTFLVAS